MAQIRQDIQPGSTLTRLALAYHASRQDFLLVFAALLGHVATSLTFWIFAFAAIKLGRDMGRRARDEGYVPPEVDPSEIPERTYFILLEPDRYGWMNWYFNKRLTQYATWSFYFVNIIFCPKHKKAEDTFGHRRLQLIHEFSHCGRGELILFIMAAFAAFSMIRTSITIYLHSSQIHLPYFNVILVTFGLYLFWSAARIMRRREHIADAIAFGRVGKPYLDYLKLRRDGDAIPIFTSRQHGWLSSLIAKVKWHPSWEERVKFIEKPSYLPSEVILGLIVTAVLTAMLVMQMTQLMMLPRQTYLAMFLFGENRSYFMRPVGYALHFIVVLWLCWLMARSVEDLRKTTWVVLTVSYGLGAALAPFTMMYSEHLHFGSGTYHHWHFILPWGTLATWVLTTVLVYSLPFLRRTPTWAFAVYSAFGYLCGLMAFLVLVHLYNEGQIQRSDPFFLTLYPPMIVGLAILLAFCMIGTSELMRRVLTWLSHSLRTKHQS